MSLTLHDAIVTKLRTRFKELFPNTPVVVEPHEGDVTPATFKRWSTASPGVYVVCLGTDPVKKLGDVPFPSWRFAAFVVARSTPCEAGETAEGKRGRVAQALATRLLAIVETESWGVKAQEAENTKADNRSTPLLAQQASVNLWVVTWQQRLQLTKDELSATESYVRDPRPLEGIDTRIKLSAPPATGTDPDATDSVSFEP